MENTPKINKKSAHSRYVTNKIGEHTREPLDLRHPLNDKKGIAFEHFVVIIALIFAAVVILVWQWPAFSRLLTGAGAQAECNWNMFLSALAGKIPFTGQIPVGCQAKYITIDSHSLQPYHNLAKKRITKYCGAELKSSAGAKTALENYYSEAANEFCKEGKPTYDNMNEWALNYIMAKEMRECWDKVWAGKLDVFKAGFFQGRHVFCVVCSVVSFGEDLPITLRNQEGIDSLYELLKAEPYFKTTYYDYLSADLPIKPDKLDLQYTTKAPIAVLFLQAKEGWLSRNWLELSLWTADIALTITLPGVGKVVGAGVRGLAKIATLGAVKYAGKKGATAIGTAGIAAVATEITPEEIEASETRGQLLIHPYQLIQAPMKEGGLECTNIIA
ncbi:MAG: hypothetical protein QW165_03720 [Candidatus Woesearchaeota archaeon]